ncbi:MAG: minor capsid protein, partial [Butyricicoccus sp.]|nr:minor capsid protein [Butyricicoccus sp.]
MYVRKTGGYAYAGTQSVCQLKGLLDTFFPETTPSTRWKYWRAILDIKLCKQCRNHHGKIYPANERPDEVPPLHYGCRCDILPMEAILPGGATKDGENGADYWLANYGKL